MAENSKIEWTDHTFNPWVGCTKVSPACDHCYAERWAKRAGNPELWNGARRRTKTWGAPVRWNRQAEKEGRRFRVFCASLADVFDNQAAPEWRAELWRLIAATPHLDWLLLTKRPQNIKAMLPDDWADGYSNVWLGTTVENQEEADRRIPHLLGVPASLRFLSCEPLLGPLKIVHHWPHKIDWIIAGGESGTGYREPDPDWFRDIRDQCEFAGIPFLFKQWSGASPAAVKARGRLLDGREWNGYPETSDSGSDDKGKRSC